MLYSAFCQIGYTNASNTGNKWQLLGSWTASLMFRLFNQISIDSISQFRWCIHRRSIKVWPLLTVRLSLANLTFKVSSSRYLIAYIVMFMAYYLITVWQGSAYVRKIIATWKWSYPAANCKMETEKSLDHSESHLLKLGMKEREMQDRRWRWSVGCYYWIQWLIHCQLSFHVISFRAYLMRYCVSGVVHTCYLSHGSA